MLQIAPENETEDETKTDDAVYCARCGHLLTRNRWAINIGGFERVFINPAGRVFRIVNFVEAPGVADEGDPTEEHTWFTGYAWNFGICLGCGVHVGWRFTGDQSPALFYGLIKTALTSSPADGQG